MVFFFIIIRDVKDAECWSQLISEIVLLTFEVATIVSPVVSNSSPEGNIPEDAILGIVSLYSIV